MSARRFAFATVAVLLLTAAAPAPTTAPWPQEPVSGPVTRLDDQVRAITSPLLATNVVSCGAGLGNLVRLADDPLFDRLTVETRRLALQTAVACSRTTTTPAAIALIRRLEPLADTPTDIGAANQILLQAAVVADDGADAARRLIRIIDADPARVADWWPRYLDRIAYHDALKANPALALALFQRLTTLAWTDADSALSARNDWAAHFAELLIARGDVAGAAVALKGMQTAELWMYVAEDRRYAALWPGLTAEGRFDWRKLTEDDLARTRIRAKDEPRQLVNAYDELQLLRQLQRYDEAIALGQDYRRRLKAGDRFTDADRYANWLLNELAYALLDTGNLAEGEAVFQDAIAAREEGSPSVSQTINWAEMLNLHGRPAEALAILRTFKPESASPYGNMWVNSGLVCALGQTGGPGVPALLDTMRAHWEDNPSALSEALVCADRLDEAAEVLIRRLRSPEHRKLAIRAFRVVAPPPVLSPRQAEMERRRAAVRTRPEVQKALEAEGRAITLPLAGAYWGAV